MTYRVQIAGAKPGDQKRFDFLAFVIWIEMSFCNWPANPENLGELFRQPKILHTKLKRSKFRLENLNFLTNTGSTSSQLSYYHGRKTKNKLGIGYRLEVFGRATCHEQLKKSEIWGNLKIWTKLKTNLAYLKIDVRVLISINSHWQMKYLTEILWSSYI